MTFFVLFLINSQINCTGEESSLLDCEHGVIPSPNELARDCKLKDIALLCDRSPGI